MADQAAAGQIIQAQEERNRIRIEELTRKKLEQHARHIDSCDGSVRHQLREWLDAITAAKRWTGSTDAHIIEMVGYLSEERIQQAGMSENQ